MHDALELQPRPPHLAQIISGSATRFKKAGMANG